MPNKLAVCFLALAGAAVALPAAAGCARFTAGDVFLTYDPLASDAAGQVIRPLSFSVAPQASSANPASSVTAQFVDFDSVSIPRIGRTGPVYTIYDNEDVVIDKASPPLRANQVFSVGLDPKKLAGQSVHGLQLIIDGGQDVPAGVYEQVLDVQYVCPAQTGDNVLQIQPAVLRIVVDVPSKIVANLAGGSRTGTLDFGDFGIPSRTASVNIYSTGPYALKVESEHNGQMVLDGTGTQSANARIGYAMTFQGQPMSTSTQRIFPRTGVSGEALPFQVTVEPVTSKRAGVYRDTITLTFAPLAVL